MVWKLLRQHISRSQLAGFFLANWCGMVIILLSIQFYQDVAPLFTQQDSFMGKDYVILSKKVSALGSLVGKGTQFSASEIEDIAHQPFAKEVGLFRPAQFNVSAGLGFQGIRFSTAMFFESVPDRFLDVCPDEWNYTEGQEEIPIILPRNYLNLYNFGFAKTRNLPQLSEGMMGMMALDIRLSGRGKVEQMKGRVVGFTNRLNTILVPETFMNWANRQWGQESESRISRLIVEVGNPADDRIAKFVKDKGYEVEGDKLDAGKTAWFLKMTVGIVMAVGAVICILSLYILMLSIYLLLQKNSTKLENLLLLGYSPSQVARPYQWLTLVLNVVVWLSAVLVVAGLRGTYSGLLSGLWNGAASGGLAVMTVCGVLLCLSASALNFWLIRRKINKIWERK